VHSRVSLMVGCYVCVSVEVVLRCQAVVVHQSFGLVWVGVWSEWDILERGIVGVEYIGEDEGILERGGI